MTTAAASPGPPLMTGSPTPRSCRLPSVRESVYGTTVWVGRDRAERIVPFRGWGSHVARAAGIAANPVGVHLELSASSPGRTMCAGSPPIPHWGAALCYAKGRIEVHVNIHGDWISFKDEIRRYCVVFNETE